MRTAFRQILAGLATMAVMVGLLVTTETPAQAAIVLNANGVTLNFDEGVQTRTVIAGTTGTSMGTAAGDIVKYAGVATISSTVIDAVIETVSVTSTTINKYDGGSAISSAPAMFQSNITTTNAGSVVYKFSFFVGGTYTAVGTGTPVILQNVYVNSYDLDASGNGSNQYTEFTGVQSYTLSTNTTMNVTGSGSMLQFKYNGANSSTNYNASDGSYTKGRVQVKYDNLSVISIKVGNDVAGSGGLSYFALDFSVGLPWTEGSTTINTTSTQNTIANSPPTSTNDTKTVTAATAAFVTTADFGAYADPDLNPWVSVSIETLPSGGNLQWYNGTTWVNVTVGQVISFLDFDSNRLRYTSNAQTTSDSLTFKVSDGLLSSVSAYTLTLTVTGGGAQAQTAQAITYVQPTNQLLPTGSLTVAPTADSGLTVTLTSSTPSVCTVSGFVITFLTTGTCTTTSSQPGDSTYSAATDVTRSFQIANAQLTAQVVTYNQPADQLLATGSLTVAPTADSGLTVTLTSSTPSVCTVSGFVITFLTTGTCTTTASQPGNSTYTAATSVTRSFQITTGQAQLPAAPDIDPVSGKTFGTNPVTLPTPINHGTSGTTCLVDPADNVCKSIVTLPGKGTFTLNPNGTTSFVAVNGFYGTATVQYRVTDSYGRSDEAPVTVEVLKPAPPAIQPIGGTTLVNQPIVLNPAPTWPNSYGKITLCLVDPADNVCKSEVTLPGKGTFTLNPNGSVTFKPAKDFIGEAIVQLRLTDELGQSTEGPVKAVVTENPGSQNGSTSGTTPVVLTPNVPVTPGSDLCLVDPTDSVCKTAVKLPGIGTWTQQPNGSVRFVPVSGYIGTTSVMQRFRRASAPAILTPYTVRVAKKRGPVTVTISGFADGSPALTQAIKARIESFLRAYSDYKNVYCIGYTEGPTVLKTDAALSKQRAVNGCNYVKAGLGKKLILKKLSASQGTVEAAKYRRITITLTD